MTLDGEGDSAGRRAELVEDCASAGRPVIQAGFLAFQAEGKGLAVLAEIMEKAGHPGLVGSAEGGGEGGGPFRDVLKVVLQRFPTLPRRARMCEVHSETVSNQGAGLLSSWP